MTHNRRRFPAALLLVLGLYGVSAFVVPTLAPVAISDDFLYTRTVEILGARAELVILPAAAMTVVFQAGWGAMFWTLFGESLGVLRVATVVFTSVSALAVYGLARTLRVDRGASALGAAIYLFNPLGYVLSFTFMTDGYFAGTVVIAAYFYARGLRDGEVHERWVLAGSFAAAVAFLVRQQGLLIPLGVLTYLVAAGRLRRDRASVRLGLYVTLVPALATAIYYVWFNYFRGAASTTAQDNYFDAWSDAGVTGVAAMIGRVTFLDAMFFGVFVLPVGLAALPRVRRLVVSVPRRGWVAMAGVVTIVAVAAALYPSWLRLPLAPHFITNEGLGPTGDLRGGRLPLVGGGVRTLATLACIVAALVVLLALCRQLATWRAPQNAAAMLVLTVLGWQAIGVLVPSLVLRDTFISYDRYFLPLLPLAVCLALWALLVASAAGRAGLVASGAGRARRPVGINLPIAIGATAVLAAVSVAGTHDFLEYQAAAWELARGARAAGVPIDRLDAGVAWDGRYLYERSVKQETKPVLPTGLPPGPLLLSDHDISPWWLTYYVPAALENDYIVAAEPLVGFTVVRRVEYPSWLGRARTYMYLLRHPDASGPP